MTQPPAAIRLPEAHNLRLALVGEFRWARNAYDERAEREAGGPTHHPAEWRDWRAAHPGPTLRQWWVDHRQEPPPGEDPHSMREPRRTFRCGALWPRAMRVAARRGDHLSEVLRRALQAYVDEYETEQDRRAA